VSRRLGAEVTLSYRRREEDMPADWEEIHEAKEEGVIFRTQTIPVEVVTKDGKAVGLKIQHAKMVADEKGGRPRPVPIENSYEILEADTVIAAIGQQADYSLLPEQVEKQLKIERGKIIVNEKGMTTYPGIFAGGDAVNRTADAISAIADGLKAVKGIDEYLKNK
jgi:glutamate synthase (NADPH/NADH) small chain